MAIRQVVKDYFTFSRKEAIGLVLVVVAFLIIFFIPRLSARKADPYPIREDTMLTRLLNELPATDSADEYNTENRDYARLMQKPGNKTGFERGERFAFDPNTLPADGWQRLGLNEKTTRTILNYRSKGGRFYKPEDLQKIWGLPDGFYEYVANYISIPAREKGTHYRKTDYKPAYEKKEYTYTTININQADTTAFIALPGIGSKLAGRIISFREKLGGFYSVEQVGETYGLPDSTFQRIKGRLQTDASAVKQFNINTATKDELKSHPYIRWNLANVIVEYRNQHGAYKSLHDLKQIALIDNKTFEKIKPYLSL